MIINLCWDRIHPGEAAPLFCDELRVVMARDEIQETYTGRTCTITLGHPINMWQKHDMKWWSILVFPQHNSVARKVLHVPHFPGQSSMLHSLVSTLYYPISTNMQSKSCRMGISGKVYSLFYLFNIGVCIWVGPFLFWLSREYLICMLFLVWIKSDVVS